MLGGRSSHEVGIVPVARQPDEDLDVWKERVTQSYRECKVEIHAQYEWDALVKVGIELEDNDQSRNLHRERIQKTYQGLTIKGMDQVQDEKDMARLFLTPDGIQWEQNGLNADGEEKEKENQAEDKEKKTMKEHLVPKWGQEEIRTVTEQGYCTREEAIRALEKHAGNVFDAILEVVDGGICPLMSRMTKCNSNGSSFLSSISEAEIEKVVVLADDKELKKLDDEKAKDRQNQDYLLPEWAFAERLMSRSPRLRTEWKNGFNAEIDKTTRKQNKKKQKRRRQRQRRREKAEASQLVMEELD